MRRAVVSALDLPTLIEIGHRWAAAVGEPLVFAVARCGVATPSGRAGASEPSPPAALLLVVQVLLGAVTVSSRCAWVIVTHLANAMILLAVLMVVGLRARAAEGAAPPRLGARHGAHGLIVATAALGSS